MRDGRSILALIILFLAVALLLLPDFIAPVCHSDNMMKCHSMANANKGIAVALMAVGSMLLFVKHRDVARGIAIGGILMAALAIANSAFLICGCASPMMSCNTKNIPATYLVAGLLILTQIAFVWKSGSRNQVK